MDKYEIPKSWEWTTLDEVFFIERGGSPRPIKSFLTDDENGINWIKIGDVAKGQKYIESTKEKIKPEGLKKSRLVVEGDFILSNSMSFGRPYIVKTQGAIHDGWLVFRDVTKELNKDFFYYLLSSSYIYQQFSRNASGSTVKNLNIEIVKQTNISLPPLNEQKRIVTKIEKLFSNLDSSDKYLLHLEKQLKRYRQSVLKSAFEGELTREWREKQTGLESADELLEKIKFERLKSYEKKFKEWEVTVKNWEASGKNGKKPRKPSAHIEIIKLNQLDIDELPKVPNSWKWLKNNELIYYVTSGSRDWKKYYSENGSRFVRTQDIKTNKLNIHDSAFVSLPINVEGKRSLIEKNDLLMTITGANVGKVAIVDFNIEEAYVSQSVALMKYVNKSMSKYLHYYFQASKFGGTFIENLVYGMGRPVLSLDNMREVPVVICSIEEQYEVVLQIEKHFSIIDKLEATVQKSIKESKRLRQSILKQAFEGKLVDQDPNDESASVLLEKIAKAKEAYKQAQKEQKKRKK